jgi:hypothetical protein
MEADVVTEVATQADAITNPSTRPATAKGATCAFRGWRMHSSLDRRRPCLWP